MRAVPLASAYLWLSLLYVVEAWKHVTPWLFTDELEFTQLSRSIAATGHAARRGEPHSFRSLYTVVTAPFWLIDNTQTAYDAIKYFDVLVMASVSLTILRFVNPVTQFEHMALLMIFTVPLTVVLSALTFRFIEKPGMNLGQRVAKAMRPKSLRPAVESA